MTAPGHVFVVQGSLTELVCDLALIPTSRGMFVEGYWTRFCPQHPDGPRPEQLEASRAALAAGERVGALLPRDGDRPAFRYVDVGIGRGHDLRDERGREAVRWLDEGVRVALDAVRADVTAGLLGGRRERPLVAVPALGTGFGGFDDVRGEVTRGLLQRCHEAVAEGGFDVVVVCLHRSDFAYLQRQRADVGAAVLDVDELERARLTGLDAADGRLSLFLGAGVSVAAGAPDFASLVRDVGARLGRPVQPTTSAEAAEVAGSLQKEFGDARLKDEVNDVLGPARASLLHGLLASLRAGTVMTTNFDGLFERSAAVTYGQEPHVMPWRRERRTPWLLKMHGSLEHEGRLTITADDLDGFNQQERPLAAVVQAQLLLHEVLFVGYSMHDADVLELALGVRDLLARQGLGEQTVGTVLAIEALGGHVAELEHALDVVDLSRGTFDRQVAARRLEVFCDAVLWHATRAEPAWQLDDRYRLEGDEVGQEAELRAALRALRVPDDDTWSHLRQVLEAYGYGRG